MLDAYSTFLVTFRCNKWIMDESVSSVREERGDCT